MTDVSDVTLPADNLSLTSKMRCPLCNYNSAQSAVSTGSLMH